MDTRSGQTADDIVNSFSEKELTDIFFKFGEEKFSRRIAARIVKMRAIAPFKTSLQLADAITQAIPAQSRRNQKIHPATRVFQALRIVVNEELSVLETFMQAIPDLLVKGGRLCVISFHSLEDRIVKKYLRNFENGCTCPKGLPECLCGFTPSMKSVFRKALKASPDEITRNPMARSARLRIAERL